jgi:hypothetical protein
MRVNPRPLRKLPLISMWICAGLDVLPVSEKDVLGHRLDPLGAVDFQRDFASDHPRRQNEIGVTHRVIRVQVRHKDHTQAYRFKGANTFVESRGLCSPHDARADIDQVGRAVDHDRGGRSEAIRVGTGRAGSKHDDPGGRLGLSFGRIDKPKNTDQCSSANR